VLISLKQVRTADCGRTAPPGLVLFDESPRLVKPAAGRLVAGARGAAAELSRRSIAARESAPLQGVARCRVLISPVGAGGREALARPRLAERTEITEISA
jgi:hypothetical protein